MDNISTHCPTCRFPLEIPGDFDNVICSSCATAYWVRRHGGALSLSEMWPEKEDSLLRDIDAGPVIDQRLADIAELAEETEMEIEGLKSREQSGPLQMGCAFFGLFMTIMVVSALFMLLGKSYLGSWMFYASIGGVILIWTARIRRKMAGPAQRDQLRQDRLLMEKSLAKLEAEHARIQKLKAFVVSEEANPEGPPD